MTILTYDKIDFKTRTATRDKKGHFIMIMESIQLKGITLVNIYILYVEAPKYIKQISMDIKGSIDSNTVIIVT